MDASGKHLFNSTSIGYIMIDNCLKVIMAKSKRVGYCLSLVAVCLVVQEVILMTIQKRIQRLSSKGIPVNNFISRKKDITNLLEDVKYLLTCLSNSRMECYNKILDENADISIKMTPL